MKTHAFLLLLLVSTPLAAAEADAPTTAATPTIPTATATPVAADAPISDPIILERGPGHRIIQTPGGGQYTELADGLCFLTTNGTYADSQDLIELLDDGKSGAIARQAPNVVRFAPNINTPGGSIDMLTSDGKRLVSGVLGIAFADSFTGTSTMIASVQNSFGKLISSNVMVFEDVFDGLVGDCVYAFKKGSFEEDVILHTIPEV